ncbi:MULTISPECIES: hypothetical protein [unclassified Ornithinimicrobium]|uniref:hypothetical protein n=1 Tax=unclassified Ornithinimicrobium TaxID=2615080 RepID=UPI0038535E99
MYQHLDLLAAQSMAHERERELQKDLRQRQAEALRPPPAAVAWHDWLHDALARLHVGHAPSH